MDNPSSSEQAWPEAGDPMFRTDPLVGCGNFLAFTEFLREHTYSTEAPTEVDSALSIVSLDINAFDNLNVTRGMGQGDVILRWIGLALVEETHERVYRMGGDEFAVALIDCEPAACEALGQRVFQRLNGEAERFQLQAPVAAVSVIHYPAHGTYTPADVFLHLTLAMQTVKKRLNKAFGVFRPEELVPTASQMASVYGVINQMVGRVVALGGMLDEANRLAYTDPLTGIPNQRAARQMLHDSLQRAQNSNTPLGLLFIDGDDLKRYNQVSYAAGDEMICKLARVLQDHLRPADRLARWRMGDEFIGLLPGANREHARLVGERLVRAVQEASQDWLMPITVSVGVVVYPEHGTQAEVLLEKAEAASVQAKQAGKNRVVEFTP